jgi:hypothetical protein
MRAPEGLPWWPISSMDHELPGNVMKRSWMMAWAAAAMIAAGALGATVGHAEEEGIDKVQADALDVRMFSGPLGKKAYACFVRRYDPDHLARHPLQKVSAMKLLVSAEIPPEDATYTYSFRLGFKYRHRSGDFDSSGSCNHFVTEEGTREMRFGCGVDCDGGGINVAMSKDNKSAIVRLERITVWQNNKPDDDARDSLVAGADDRIFRLDRTDTRECASLVTDRKELAAIRHK